MSEQSFFAHHGDQDPRQLAHSTGGTIDQDLNGLDQPAQDFHFSHPPEEGDRPEVVLSVRNVSKKFCRRLRQSLMYGIQDIATEVLGIRQESAILRNGEFWALHEVSLDLYRGQALGLIGVNGSGKTTLLRIISGLMRPDTGEIRYQGRMAPLIALGAGFNPVLTGRENIYANMSILGLSKSEIDDRYDDVVNFAEIGDAIEAPVQSYSSGMAARLGFACAVYTEPDILLIDEVLAVGDARFRAKCQRKLADLLSKGTSFILVNHSFQGILNICTNAVYLSQGKVVNQGNANDVMQQYEQDLFSGKVDTSVIPLMLPEKPPQERTEASLKSIYFRDEQGHITDAPTSGTHTSICVSCLVHQKVSAISLFIAIYHPAKDNELALHLSSAYDGDTFESEPGEYELSAKLPYLGLLPGAYSMSVYIKDGPMYTLDAYEQVRFKVNRQQRSGRGVYYQAHHWELHPVDLNQE